MERVAPQEDPKGTSPAGTQAADEGPRSWLDLLLHARSVPPQREGAVHVRRGPNWFELRLTQPRHLLLALTLAALAAVPQLRDLAAWCITHLAR